MITGVKSYQLGLGFITFTICLLEKQNPKLMLCWPNKWIVHTFVKFAQFSKIWLNHIPQTCCQNMLEQVADAILVLQLYPSFVQEASCKETCYNHKHPYKTSKTSCNAYCAPKPGYKNNNIIFEAINKFQRKLYKVRIVVIQAICTTKIGFKLKKVQHKLK